jgi:hypothetical protein
VRSLFVIHEQSGPTTFRTLGNVQCNWLRVAVPLIAPLA